jgi:hypothetical protein
LLFNPVLPGDSDVANIENKYNRIEELISKFYLHVYRSEENLEVYMNTPEENRDKIRKKLRDMRLRQDKLPKFQSAQEIFKKI